MATLTFLITLSMMNKEIRYPSMSLSNINGARQNTLSKTLGKGSQMTKVSTLTGKLNQSNGINRQVGSTFLIKITSLN
mgnify:CR=1 FL=1